jgi:hypothetical protein
MDTRSDRPLKVVLFVDFDVRNSYPLYAQCLLRKMLDQGHHVALFGMEKSLRQHFIHTELNKGVLKAKLLRNHSAWVD